MAPAAARLRSRAALLRFHLKENSGRVWPEALDPSTSPRAPAHVDAGASSLAHAELTAHHRQQWRGCRSVAGPDWLETRWAQCRESLRLRPPARSGPPRAVATGPASPSPFHAPGSTRARMTTYAH